MEIEGKLGELMTEATRALSMPTEAMAVEAAVRGRRLRARRRAAVFGGTAMVVVVAVAGAVFGAGLGWGGRQVQVGGGVASAVPSVGSGPTAGAGASATRGGEASASADAGAPVTVSGVPDPFASALVPVDLAEEIDFLGKLLPHEFKIVGHVGPASGVRADVLIDDGLGRSEVDVEVGVVGSGGLSQRSCAEQAALLPGVGPRPSGAPAMNCTVNVLPDKDQVMTDVSGMVYPGLYEYKILVNRTDGVAVEITVANGTWVNPAEVTRAVPPLTLGAWTQVALCPLWQPAVPVPSSKMGAGFTSTAGPQ